MRRGKKHRDAKGNKRDAARKGISIRAENHEKPKRKRSMKRSIVGSSLFLLQAICTFSPARVDRLHAALVALASPMWAYRRCDARPRPASRSRRSEGIEGEP
jgi:hypothetical protein